jgi:hypothetical protein
MIKQRSCPICGGNICIEYITPSLHYYITEDGKIERDDNHDLWSGTESFLMFKFENDAIHDLNQIEEGRPIGSMQKWQDEVTKEFYERGLQHIEGGM